MIKLKSIEFLEKKDNIVIYKAIKFDINDFTLLIGDNAQGKSRFFRSFTYLSSLASGKPKVISTKVESKLIFVINGSDEIIYDLNVDTNNNENIFNETIFRNGQEIFSKDKNILTNEVSNENISNFFIPDNLPAISSVNKPEFKTITLIREFLQRIIFISATKGREITITTDGVIPSNNGSNIASVLKNWEKKFKPLYNELIEDFKDCFNFIKNVSFNTTPIANNQTTDLLTISEKKIKEEILQTDWSDGIYRALLLLMLPKIPFKKDDKTFNPSIILIDEIENGLDFKTLKYIIKYLQDYSDSCQIMVSSHSPLVCQFIHPKKWRIVKRNGANINFLSPTEIEENIVEQLEMFKREHWMFYTKHISNSKLYLPK